MASGEIVLSLDKVIHLDRPRTFRLSWNEMAAFEALRQSRTGERTSFLEFLVNPDWTLEDMRLLLWVGLRHEDESLTEDALGKILGLQEMSALLCRKESPIAEVLLAAYALIKAKQDDGGTYGS